MPKYDRPGQPSKLTEETKTALLNAIKAGLTYDLACGAAGISFQTFRNWQLRGEKEKTGQYFEFLEDLKEAEGQGSQRLITLINRSANEGQWQAGAWILERRYPEHFSRRATQEKTQAPEKPEIKEEASEKDKFLAELKWVRERASHENNLELVLKTLEQEARVRGIAGDADEAELNAFLSGVHTVKQMATEDLSE